MPLYVNGKFSAHQPGSKEIALMRDPNEFHWRQSLEIMEGREGWRSVSEFFVQTSPALEGFGMSTAMENGYLQFFPFPFLISTSQRKMDPHFYIQTKWIFPHSFQFFSSKHTESANL